VGAVVDAVADGNDAAEEVGEGDADFVGAPAVDATVDGAGRVGEGDAFLSAVRVGCGAFW
ncbi:MAG TPA: hypothetical protein VFN80_11265, partial [Acidothermaceae bacterium]|nr:hypothetical protein [Acidothermaceae bacterium]